MNVLILEDNEVNRMVLVETLCFLQKNIMLTLTTTVEQAKEKIDTNSYDLLLLDLAVPSANKEDGLDVITYARNSKNNAKAVIAMVSAYVFENDQKSAFARGVDFFIEKPIAIDSIIKVLDFTKNIDKT